MPTPLLITGNGLWSLGDTGPEVVGIVTFQVSGVGAATITPRRTFMGSGATPATTAYRNELAQAEVAQGTAITANGIYSVRAGPTEVLLDVSGYTTPIGIDYAPLYGTRRRAASGFVVPEGNETLVADLGGDANVIGFWDARGGVTVATGVSQWDDTRGSSGFGPSLAQAVAARQPAYDGGASTITFAGGGITRNTLVGAAAATFDLSTAHALVLIGAVSHAATGDLYAALVQDGAFARYLGVRASASNTDILTIATAGNRASGVLGHATTRRIIIAAKDATTSSTIEIPNDAKVSGVGSATAAGNNFLVVGGFTDDGTGARFVCRAVLFLDIEPSVAQVTALKNYAVTYHGVTLV